MRKIITSISLLFFTTLALSLSSIQKPVPYISNAGSNDLWTYNSTDQSYSITQANSHYQCSGWDGNVYHDPFYLIDNANAGSTKGYTASATFYNTATTPMETLQYGTVKLGFLPYFLDQSNFVCINLFWANDVNANKMRSINATICSNGTFYEYDLAWIHDNSTYSALQVNSNYSSGFTFNCVVSSSEITFSVNNKSINCLTKLTTANCHMSTFINASSKLGLWSWWSDTKVTNVSTKSNSYILNPNWKNIGSDESKWNVPADASKFVSTNTSWMDNFLVTTGANYQCSFRMTACFKGTKSAATSGNNILMGLIPYYVDAQNYIIFYFNWDTAGLAEICITGQLGGSNLRVNSAKTTSNVSGKSPFNDIWMTSSTTYHSIKPSAGLRMMVDRVYDTTKHEYAFKLYISTIGASNYTALDTIYIKNFTAVDAAKQCYAGFMTQNDTVTINNYAITNYGNNGNVGVGKSGNGGFIITANNASDTNNSLWSYNASNFSLIANPKASQTIINSYLGNHALKQNTNTNYYVGSKIRAQVAENEYAGSGQASQRRIGLFAYRSTDGNSFVIVDMCCWSDACYYITISVQVIINGTAPAEGEWTEWQIDNKRGFMTELNTLEVGISGNTVSVYLNDANKVKVVGSSTEATLSKTYTGLSTKIASDKGYYGAHVQNVGGEFISLKTSTSKIYPTLVNKPVISISGSPTTGKVNNIVYIYATSNVPGLNEFINPTIKVTNPSGGNQAMYHVSTNGAAFTTPYYFVPTVAGTYKVDITAKDRAGNEATPVSYDIVVS